VTVSRLPQEWQRVADRPGGLAATIPADEHRSADGLRHKPIRNDEHGRGAAKYDTLREQKWLDPSRVFGVGLPDHDQIHELALATDYVKAEGDIAEHLRHGLFGGLACGFGVARCDELCSTGFVDRRHIGVWHDVNPSELGAEALGQYDQG
jgi:hypothetical protein